MRSKVPEWFDPALTPWAGGLGLWGLHQIEPSQATGGSSSDNGAVKWMKRGHIVSIDHLFLQSVPIREQTEQIHTKIHPFAQSLTDQLIP